MYNKSVMDFSKTENIIFVSVVGAAILFFLATAIAVIAKGKRTCKAGDVLLRIASSLAFACSVAMLACVVMSQLTGGYRIDVSAAPTLYFGSETVVLPMPQLFSALASSVGSSLVTGITVVSLMALVCDCLLANKKKEKAAEQNEAGENGGISEKSEKFENAENAEIDESVSENVQNAAAQTGDEIAGDVGEPYNAEDPKAAHTAEAADTAETENTYEKEKSAELDADDEISEAAAVDAGDIISEIYGDGSSDEATEEAEADAAYSDEEKPWYNEDGEFDLDTEGKSTEPEQTYADPESDENRGQTPATDDAFASADEYTYDGTADPEPETESSVEREQTEQEQERESAEPANEPELDDDIARGERELEELLKESVEPDRDIYIPKIRTVDRSKSKTARSSSGKAASKIGGNAPKAKNGDRRGARSGGKNKESAATEKTANKSLPMGRRYVIIDRRSAVNIFSDYLKERDKQDKDKLESSINKIILK